MSDLGTLYPDCASIETGSTAFSANSKTQIVGTSACDNVAAAAFLWEQGGPMIDLNTLIPSNSGMQLVIGASINERGEVAGLGVLPNGDTHAFLLIPCGESIADCGDSAPSTSARQSDSTLTVAQRLAISQIMAGFRTRLAGVPAPRLPRY